MKSWKVIASRSRLEAQALAVIVVAAVAVSGCGIDPEVELANARARFEEGDHRTAIIHIGNLLQQDANMVEPRIMRGRILLAGGDAERARDEFELAERLGASGAELLLPLADATVRTGEPDRALEILATIPPTDRDDSYAVLMAEALIGADRVDEAAAMLEAAEVSPAVRSRALVAAARIAVRGNENERAEALLTEAVGAAGGRLEAAEAHSARAAHYQRLRRLDLAAADLQVAADRLAGGLVGPTEVAVLTRLVQVQVALNDIEAASETARHMAERAPSSLASSYTSALVAFENGRFDEVIREMQVAINSVPNNSVFNTLLGAAQLAKGDYFQAEQQLIRAVNANPDDPAAVKLLAETRIRQQRPEAALDALRPLANVDSDPQYLSLQGIANLQVGRLDEGILYLERALANNSGNPALPLELARAYVMAGRADDALALLETQGLEDDGLATQLMALVSHVQQGDTDSAREMTEELTASHPDDPDALTAAAILNEMLGNQAQALELLARAIELDGDNIAARLIMSGLLADEGREQEAERMLRRIVEDVPGHPAALAALGQLALARGELDEAASLYERSLASYQDAPIHLALARVQMQRGDLEAADEQIDEAAKLSVPGDFDVMYTRGLLALVEGRYSDAIALLNAVAVERPNRPDIALALARAQAASEDFEAARRTLLRADAATPGSMPIRNALGMAEIRLGNHAESLEIAKNLQVEHPQQAEGYLLESQLLLVQRRYAAAADVLEAAYATIPSWEIVAQWLLALQLEQDIGGIRSVLETWLAEAPTHVPGRLSYASLLQTEGSNREALAEFERVLETAPDNVVALNNAAWLQHELSQPGAEALARRAQRLAPDNPAVLDTLGWILTRQGDPESGVGYLERASGFAPDAGEIKYHYGYALAGAGRTEAARQVLAELLENPAEFAGRGEAEALLESL